MGQVTVEHDATGHRYVLRLEGRQVGSADYVHSGGAVVITHTEIEAAHAANGLGTALVAAALDDLRVSGATVVPRCPFVAAFIDSHPEYADLVGPQPHR